MDNIFQTLLSWQFVLFCLGLTAIVFIVRKTFEYVLANVSSFAKSSKVWKELILPIFPIVLGPLVAYIAKEYPYGDTLKFTSGRLMFGLVAGLLSGLMYRVIKSFLTTKIAPETTPERPDSETP